jgi:hypothetical protein|tara:strand:+ start:1548 stop:1940 length:393 start_codon:yes stop_codon:yes gene_type:complete
MFKEILRVEFSDFVEIVKNPSQFLQQEFNVVLSDNEIYFTFVLIMLFLVGLLFDLLKPKKEILDSDLPDNNYKSNEIASNTIIQKTDLANAYISMGKKTKAKSIIDRLEKNQLSKSEKKEINKLKRLLDE